MSNTTQPSIVDPTSSRIGGYEGATFPYEDMAAMVVSALAGELDQRISMERNPEQAQARLDQLVADFLASVEISPAHARFVAAVQAIDTSAPRKAAIMAAFDASFRPDSPARTATGQRDPLGLRRR